MADDVAPNVGPTWLTYPELADRLGLATPAAAAARARRAKWPKRLRNDTGQAEVEVPADALPAARRSPPDAPRPRRPDVAPDVTGDAVRAAVAPLQAILEAQAADLQNARTTLDATRGALADAQADAAAAKARAETLAAQVEREVADRRTLQGQADALRDQLASAQLDAARIKGDATAERAKREAAEARMADLQRQVEALQTQPRRRWWWSR